MRRSSHRRLAARKRLRWAAAAPDGAPGGRSKLRLRRVFRDVGVIARGTMRRFLDAKGPDLASSLAYSSLLTVIPLVASVTLLTSTFFGNAGAGFYRILRLMVPGMTLDLAARLQAMAIQAASLTGTASLFFFLTSFRTFFLIEGAARALWGASGKPRRSSVKRLGLALFFMALGPVVAGIVTSFLLENGASITAFRTTSALATIGLIVILYRVLPGSHVRWGPAIAAAVAAGAALTLTRVAFTRGVARVASLSVLYGSITAVVVFVLAIGVAFVIFLLGVSLAHALQFREELFSHDAPETRTEEAGPHYEAVRLLLHLAVAWRNDRSTRTLRALSNGMERPEEDLAPHLASFVDAGLVVIAPDGAYELSRPPDRISLYAVARAIGESAERPVPSGSDPIAQTLRRVFSKANREERGVLQGTSLRDVMTRDAP